MKAIDIALRLEESEKTYKIRRESTRAKTDVYPMDVRPGHAWKNE